MSKYIITLTPTGSFFFGGDMAFSVNEKESEFTSYIIHSSKFPQQTSLLGMLRFLILRNNGEAFDSETQEICNKDKAKELIGDRSFMITDKAGTFGVIDSIGPCFLQAERDNQWIDLKINPKDKSFGIDFSNCTKAVANGHVVDIPDMNYNPKEYYPTSYQVGEETIKEDDIFKEDISTGINRDIYTGKVNDNSLFKRISYRMKGYRFAFYANISINDLEKYNNNPLVTVGGDNSQFIVGIKKCDDNEAEVGKGKRVFLLSPAYLSEEDLKDARYAITDTIPFRCMMTETDTVKSYNKRNHLYGYSKKYSLFTSGSVFFFKTDIEAESFTEKLKSHADFYQIGYNHFQVTD